MSGPTLTSGSVPRPTFIWPSFAASLSANSSATPSATWKREAAAGEPRLLEDLGGREHRRRRLLGRLDDHRAARRDRRADLAGAHGHREVPRGDEHARADRLLEDEHALPGRLLGHGVAALDA